MSYDPNVGTFAVGYSSKMPSGFGICDGEISIHIYGEDLSLPGQPIVPGNAPFRVELKFNGEIVGFKDNIPVCLDPANLNMDPAQGDVTDFNCIIGGLGAGKVDLFIFDSANEEMVRIYGAYTLVSPPKVLLDSIVNPNSEEEDTIVSFEFGLTEEYGSEVQFPPIRGLAPVHCKLELHSQGFEGDPTSVLLPGTTYHYRVKAVNPFGPPQYGDDMEFTTLTYEPPAGMAPTVQTLRAIILA